MPSSAASKAPKNLLPQSLNFKPGTSLIGNFGSTDDRFKPLPGDQVACDYPGPAAYMPIATQVQTRGAQWTWGTGVGHALASGSQVGPGPGAYGAEQHPMGILTTLRRQWPGIASKSAFGSNEERPLAKAGTSGSTPGPGQYDVEEASYFTSGEGKGSAARSPFLAAARARTGSRLQRDADLKVGSVFASRLPAHQMPGSGPPGAAVTSAVESEIAARPGPGSHSPQTNTIGERHARQRRQLLLRSDSGTGTSFDTTAERFRDRDNEPEFANPGPGSHDVARWSGEQPSQRRPPHAAQPLGFLSSSERWNAGSRRDLHRHAVLAYLADGSAGQIGVPTHAQSAIQRASRR